MENVLNKIVIYPVKGLGGISLKSSKCDMRGLANDRRYLIVDEQGQFLSQREISTMALIETEFEDEVLTLRHGTNSISLTLSHHSSRKLEIKIWSHEFEAYLANSDIDEWLSTAIGRKCHLVYMDKDIIRNKSLIKSPGNTELSFADGYPYLILGSASMDQLNKKLEVPVSSNRFRANLLISTEEAHEEDEWHDIMIGAAKFRIIKPCARCKVITINQQTGEQGVEPLKTLSTYRKDGRKVNFGANAICLTPGEIIKVGDKIEVCKK